MQKGKQMVATRYRSGNKYLRELQLHPAVEYLLQCFVVPSSVVLVWRFRLWT